MPVRPFQLLVKPVSGDCNLACTYCFYTRVPDMLYPQAKPHRMDDETLDRMIGEFLSCGFSPAVMCWQGGEPTLAGLDFFGRVVELQQKHGKSGQAVGNAFQTNGLLIDDEWSRFLAQYHFLVGLSLDGPAYLHDKQRVHATGSGSWRQVMRAARRFSRDGVAFNVLCVVSRANQDHGREVFQWLIHQGFAHVQFIPCVEADPETNEVAQYSVTSEGFGKFLCDVFDEWLRIGPTRVSVRDFDSVLRYHLEGQHDICTYRRTCGGYLLVEHNGDVYPCDFFAAKDWRLGRIGDMPLTEFFGTEKMQRFIHAKHIRFDECRDCRWLKTCHGGCQKDRLAFGSVESAPTYLCPGYKTFFEHSQKGFTELAETIRKQQANAGEQSKRKDKGRR